METSSGLHHDYHDNLYCIWDGCKTIQLAPPQSVGEGITTQGTFLKLHDNGRIVYKEQVRDDGGMIRPDGALEQVEIILRLQIRQQVLEHQLDKDPDNQDLEEMLERVQDELLDIERDDSAAGDANILFDGRSVGGFDDDDETDNSDDNSSGSNVVDGKTASSQDEPSAKKQKMERPCTPELPLNFATNFPTDDLFETIILEKEDLLYLPAGWFHNVLSKGSDASGGVHMAMNYWLHPPDISGTFEKPYLSEFWPRDWEGRFNS
ncbi:DnaJ-like protein [Fragilaria crotonensis]|nr:DnaJ-like protein [Fragilaria crotonensis]